jgi:hypothetical protein
MILKVEARPRTRWARPTQIGGLIEHDGTATPC